MHKEERPATLEEARIALPGQRVEDEDVENGCFLATLPQEARDAMRTEGGWEKRVAIGNEWELVVSVEDDRWDGEDGLSPDDSGYGPEIEWFISVWAQKVEEKEEPVVLLPRGGGHTCADNPTIPCANKECEAEARKLNGMRPIEPGKSEETLIRQAILLLEEEDEQDGLGEDASLAITLLHHVEHVREMRKGGAPEDGCGMCREEMRENSRIGNEGQGWTDPYEQKEHD